MIYSRCCMWLHCFYMSLLCKVMILYIFTWLLVDKFPSPLFFLVFCIFTLFIILLKCMRFYIYIIRKAAEKKCNFCFRQLIHHQPCVVCSRSCLLLFAVDRKECLTVEKKLLKFLQTVKQPPSDGCSCLALRGCKHGCNIFRLLFLIVHATRRAVLDETVLNQWAYEERRHVLINCKICLQRLVVCSFCRQKKVYFWTVEITVWLVWYH